MTDTDGRRPNQNSLQTMRLLRVAIGRGRDVEHDGYTYSVGRAQVRFGPGSQSKREMVLLRTAADGTCVALEVPRQSGRSASTIQVSTTAADGTSRVVKVLTDVEAIAATSLIANNIVGAVHSELLAEIEPWLEALNAYRTANGASDATTETMMHELRARPGDVEQQVQAVEELRNRYLEACTSGVREATSALAARIMTTMVDDPATVAAFAELGYTVEPRTVAYSDQSYVATDVPVATVVHGGVPVHDAPSTAPNDPAKTLARRSASRAAMCVFLSDSADLIGVLPVRRIPLPEQSQRAIDANITRIRTALGPRGSAVVNGVVYATRPVTGFNSRGQRGNQTEGTVVYALAPRDSRIPACLAVPTMVDWPGKASKDPAYLESVFTSESDVKFLDVMTRFYATQGRTSSDDATITCIDTRLNRTAQALASRDVREIVEVALERELDQLAEYRDLLANCPTTGGKQAASRLDAELPAITAESSADDMLDIIDTLRTRVIEDARAAIDREAPAIADALARSLAMGGTVYAEGLRRGYDLVGYDIPYSDTTGRQRWIVVTLLAMDGNPIQAPPQRHPKLDNNVFSGRKPAAPDRETALRLIRDSVDLEAMQTQARGLG